MRKKIRKVWGGGRADTQRVNSPPPPPPPKPANPFPFPQTLISSGCTPPSSAQTLFPKTVQNEQLLCVWERLPLLIFCIYAATLSLWQTLIPSVGHTGMLMLSSEHAFINGFTLVILKKRGHAKSIRRGGRAVQRQNLQIVNLESKRCRDQQKWRGLAHALCVTYSSMDGVDYWFF